jgi:acyl carrier protein
MEQTQRQELSQRMIDYIVREVIRRPEIEVTENSPLVSSGLIDSLALVTILHELEDVTRMRIPAAKVQPKDMDTVALMLATAERVGKARK